MVAFFRMFSPVVQALIATMFTWFVTALGAASVFMTKEVDRRVLDVMLGFAGGVMVAASYWSLLAPALEMSAGMGVPEWFPPAIGFLLGGAFLRLLDRLLPHLHVGEDQPEGLKVTWQRITLLILAITLHNLPEGLAVGVAFGASGAGIPGASVAGAIALALGIGIQNFPEGVAVAMPLRTTDVSPAKSFMFGQLSAIVEPIAGVLGAAAVLIFRPILPYAMAFAAGAMIFVVVEDLIPEAHAEGNVDLATLGVMFGFVVMMILDVALG
ncbi:MAG: ZIP family metal transporter [Anaerolineae bacterium]